MASRAGKTSVPQIWFGEDHIGGCDDLHELHASGDLFDALN
jgi:glutaredoxin 3